MMSEQPLPTGDDRQIEAVVFDLGGVLIDWDPRYLYRKIVDDEAFIEWFLTEVCSPDWNAEQDAGRSWADAAAEAKARHPSQAELIDAYVERWPEMIAGDIVDTVDVLERVAATGIPLFALTNWSAETFHVARERFRWLRHFSDILVSGELGMKKPDPRIFRLLIERIGVEPAAVVFIDDALHNVETAGSLGLRAIRFTTAADLRRHPDLVPLFSRGVNPA